MFQLFVQLHLQLLTRRRTWSVVLFPPSHLYFGKSISQNSASPSLYGKTWECFHCFFLFFFFSSKKTTVFNDAVSSAFTVYNYKAVANYAFLWVSFLPFSSSFFRFSAFSGCLTDNNNPTHNKKRRYFRLLLTPLYHFLSHTNEVVKVFLFLFTVSLSFCPLLH